MKHHALVGVCGKAGSGKDTVANHLVHKHNFKPLVLAAPIKTAAKLFFGFSDRQLWGPSGSREQHMIMDWDRVFKNMELHGEQWLKQIGYPEHTKELARALDVLYDTYPYSANAREVLQYLGTEFGRHQLGENIWVDKVIKDAETCFQEEHYAGVVISDVRFANEINAIVRAHGKVIKLLRKGKTQVGIHHSSEVEQDTVSSDTFSLIVNNNKTISELYDAIDMFITCLKE